MQALAVASITCTICFIFTQNAVFTLLNPFTLQR